MIDTFPKLREQLLHLQACVSAATELQTQIIKVLRPRKADGYGASDADGYSASASTASISCYGASTASADTYSGSNTDRSHLQHLLPAFAPFLTTCNICSWNTDESSGDGLLLMLLLLVGKDQKRFPQN